MIATIKDDILTLVAEDLDDAGTLDRWTNAGNAIRVDWCGYRLVLDQLAQAGGVAQ